MVPLADISTKPDKQFAGIEAEPGMPLFFRTQEAGSGKNSLEISPRKSAEMFFGNCLLRFL
jgi:hypothetical protein